MEEAINNSKRKGTVDALRCGSLESRTAKAPGWGLLAATSRNHGAKLNSKGVASQEASSHRTVTVKLPGLDWKHSMPALCYLRTLPEYTFRAKHAEKSNHR